jgi:aminoglycoside phosphotransferase (APT) family kinase protein
VADEIPDNPVPWRRSQAELEVALQAWARDLRGDGATITEVRVPDSGMANDTIMFVLDDEPFVARLAPHPESPYLTFPTFDLELQRRVIQLVRDKTDVPVPEIVQLEESHRYVGVPFLVARAVGGNVPSDNPPYLLDPSGWFLQGSPEDWARLEQTTIEVLVRLHRVSGEGEEAAFLHHDLPGETPLAHQREYYEWARDGRSIPVLERALELLEATLPPNGKAVLNWGDSRPGNIIYQDFEPAAVLDWEMATVGPPEVDLAWATFFQRFFASMGERYGLPPGAGDVPPGADRGRLRAPVRREARSAGLVRGVRRPALRDHPGPDAAPQHRLRRPGGPRGPQRPDDVPRAPRSPARGDLR